MVEAVREVIPDCSVGHVLVQRDESDPEKKPKFYYKKFPKGIEGKVRSPNSDSTTRNSPKE
jgi:uracil phosphoribosyltransferase